MYVRFTNEIAALILVIASGSKAKFTRGVVSFIGERKTCLMILSYESKMVVAKNS